MDVVKFVLRKRRPGPELPPGEERYPRVPSPLRVELIVGCKVLMLLRNPKVPSPTMVEVTFEVLAKRFVSTVLKNPRVPNPISVELRTGCIELILLKNPDEPRPSTVEFILDVLTI